MLYIYWRIIIPWKERFCHHHQTNLTNLNIQRQFNLHPPRPITGRCRCHHTPPHLDLWYLSPLHQYMCRSSSPVLHSDLMLTHATFPTTYCAVPLCDARQCSVPFCPALFHSAMHGTALCHPCCCEPLRVAPSRSGPFHRSAIQKYFLIILRNLS